MTYSVLCGLVPHNRLCFFHPLLTILSTSAKWASCLFLTVWGLLFMPGLYTWNSLLWECSNYHTIALISHSSKIMLKILQARLQQYVNRELPDVQAGFRKGRGTREIANIWWIIEKAREFQKNIYFCFIDYAKAFDRMDHSKLWKSLKEMGIPDRLTCLLRNLYAGQEATVRTGHGTWWWLQPWNFGTGCHDLSFLNVEL